LRFRQDVAVSFGRQNQVVGLSAAQRAARVRQQHHHPAYRSRIILPPRRIAAVAQSLAEAEPEDLSRLQAVLEEAQGTDASADEVAKRVEKEVPTASFLAPLLKDAGTPLAQWIMVLLALLTLILMYRQQQQAQPTITPEQVEEIVGRVVDELNIEPPTEPATDKPKRTPKAAKKQREPRSSR
jgi:hypothetical protein